MIEAQAGKIIYREHLPAWVRVFAFVIGAGCATMIPYPFIIYERWSEPSWSTPMAAFAVLFSVGCGLLFIVIALGGSQRLIFDRTRRTLLRSTRGPLGEWNKVIPFSAIEKVDTVQHDGEDGPEFRLELRVTGEKRAIQMVGLGDRSATDAWRDRIAAIVR